MLDVPSPACSSSSLARPNFIRPAVCAQATAFPSPSRRPREGCRSVLSILVAMRPPVRRVIGADVCRVDERDDGFPGRASVGDSPSRGRAGEDGPVCTAAGSWRAGGRPTGLWKRLHQASSHPHHHGGEGETGLWAACGEGQDPDSRERLCWDAGPWDSDHSWQ